MEVTIMSGMIGKNVEPLLERWERRRQVKRRMVFFIKKGLRDVLLGYLGYLFLYGVGLLGYYLSTL